MKHDVSITIDGKNVALPVLEASAGLDVVDVRGLINEGLFTFDPGFSFHGELRIKNYLHRW